MFKSRNESNIVYKCTVRLLEDVDVLECEFQPNHRGNFLLEYVCEQLEIADKDYFGLRYVDSTKQRHWLDLSKYIIKQVKDVDPILFSFRVKFYPADPFRLNGNGKFFLYQQLKRDLRHGRLYCSAAEAAALGVLVVQEELGDYDPDIHTGDYVSSVKLVLRQTEQLERKVIELHQKREPGQDSHIPIDEFMSIARGLETYGVDPHPVKDYRGTQLYLGINHSGINTFAAGRRAQHFRWSEIHKLNYEGKMFIAHLHYTDKESREPKKHTVGFKCPTGAACRYIWRCSIEQMLFFTLPNSQNASVMSGGGFMRGTKFRYSGRTEREILTENLNALRQQHLANNTSPSKRKANSVPATPSSPQGDLAEIRYSSLPRSTMSEPLGCSGGQTSSAYCPESTLPLLETVSEEARRQTNLENNGFSDCYFRDSFDHSSSDSGLTSVIAAGDSNRMHQHHRYFQHHTSSMAVQHSAATTAVSTGGTAAAVAATSSTNSTIPSAIDHHHHHQPHQQQHNHHQQHHHHSHQQQQQQPHQALIMQNSSNNSAILVNQQNATNNAKSMKKFSLLHAFVPSFIFVVITLVVTTIFILESDSELIAPIRSLPEMISLKYHYYQPLKDYFFKRFKSN